MIVACPSCEKKYKFSEEKLGKRGAKITCPKCRHVFVVYKDREIESLGRKNADGTIEADDRATNQPAPPRDPWPRDFPTWSFRELGATWRVRKQQGLTYDFYSLEELNGFLEERQVSRSDEISVNGRDWVQIAEFSNLTAYFYDIWKRIEAGEIELDDDEEDEEDEADAPTTIMGAASSLADEIRRAVQDARTPAPAADRIRSTPRPATPRGAGARSVSSGSDPHGAFVPPPSPAPAPVGGPSWGGPSGEPSWGGPEVEPEDETVPEQKWGRPAESTWGSTPMRDEEPPAPKIPPRPAPSPVEGGGPASFSNAPGRAAPAFPDEPTPPPPKPITDPFAALNTNPGHSAPPPPKSIAPPPKAEKSGGGGGMLVAVVLVLLVAVVGGAAAGLKFGVIPASSLPFEVPAALLPDAPAPAAPAPAPAPAPVPAEGGE
ncbi:MAG: hypothetical protein EP329_05890 [Deltaproteobacteria bacterium]|nr:MAG: hypothetical protein EP329_05890 [Deltaproteobacteria bacterium]